MLSFCEFNWLSHFQFFEYNRDKVKLLHNSINTNKLIMCAGNKTNKLKCNFRFSLTDLPVATGRCVTIFSRFSLTDFSTARWASLFRHGILLSKSKHANPWLWFKHRHQIIKFIYISKKKSTQYPGVQ